MALLFNEKHNKEIRFLRRFPPDVLVTFSNVAFDYLEKGLRREKYQKAAENFNVSVERIENSVESLGYMMLQCYRFGVSEEDLNKVLLSSGFNDRQARTLAEYYVKNKSQMEPLFEKSDKSSYFYDLQWRFESKISSRALLEQVTPLVTMNIKIGDSATPADVEKTQNILLQTDSACLFRITDSLEKALQELRSQNLRKIEKKIRKLSFNEV